MICKCVNNARKLSPHESLSQVQRKRHDPNEKDIGWRMSEIRKVNGKTLKEMATRIGVSTSFLCQLEHGQRHWKQRWIEGYLKLVV